MQVHAEEAERRDLLDELARQDALLEPLADVRHDALLDELPHGVADRALLVFEQRVDGEEVTRIERGVGRRCHIVSLAADCDNRRLHGRLRRGSSTSSCRRCAHGRRRTDPATRAVRRVTCYGGRTWRAR